MYSVEDQGASAGVPRALGVAERSSLQSTLRRVMYHPAYLGFYVFMLLCSIFTFIWFFVEKGANVRSTAFLVFEIGLNLVGIALAHIRFDVCISVSIV